MIAPTHARQPTNTYQGALSTTLPQQEPAILSAQEEFEAQGFEIYPASFTGDFGPNGETMTLNGTIQEVMDQIEGFNPGFTAEVNKHIATAAAAAAPSGEDDAWRERKVAKKDCFKNKSGRALKSRVLEGVEYLYNVPKDKARLQSRGCSRVSCSWDAAIFLCWEPFEGAPEVYEQPWWYVGDYAKGIALEWCPTTRISPGGRVFEYAQGKTWDPKGLAVHVREDRC